MPLPQDARKGVLFDDFPPVLQLQLKRFEYDFQRDIMIKVQSTNTVTCQHLQEHCLFLCSRACESSACSVHVQFAHASFVASWCHSNHGRNKI